MSKARLGAITLAATVLFASLTACGGGRNDSGGGNASSGFPGS